MKDKIISEEQAVAMIPSGATLMLGGFMGCGSAHRLIDALSRSNVKDLTIISNDASMPGGPIGDEHYGIAKLIHNRQVKTLIATHVGMNPEVAEQSMKEGTLEVLLVPQGSMAEMIRAGGSGLGGVLTPTGIGTIVEESPLCLGRQTIKGKEYLLMSPLHADIAIIAGAKVDKAGNVWYKGSTINFNSVMSMAADLVIAEAREIVEVGEIAPEDVRTAGVLVDYVMEGRKY